VHIFLTNMALAKLNLWDDNVCPEGAAAHSLLTNVTLTKLNLWKNNIGPEGVELMTQK
jgi:hypothetical protein